MQGHPGRCAAFPQCRALPLSAAQASPTQRFLKGSQAAIPPNYNLLHLHVVFHYNSSLHLSGWVARQPRADLLAHSRAGTFWSRCSCAGGPLRRPPSAVPCALCPVSPRGLGDSDFRVPRTHSVCWLTRGLQRSSDTVNPVLSIPVLPHPVGPASGFSGCLLRLREAEHCVVLRPGSNTACGCVAPTPPSQELHAEVWQALLPPTFPPSRARGPSPHPSGF